MRKFRKSETDSDGSDVVTGTPATRTVTGSSGIRFTTRTRVLSGGVYELKIDAGPGYRVYYTERNQVLVILLCGGDKSTQDSDIKTALMLAQGL